MHTHTHTHTQHAHKQTRYRPALLYIFIPEQLTQDSILDGRVVSVRNFVTIVLGSNLRLSLLRPFLQARNYHHV